MSGKVIGIAATAPASGAMRSSMPNHSTNTNVPTDLTTKLVRLVSGKAGICATSAWLGNPDVPDLNADANSAFQQHADGASAAAAAMGVVVRGRTDVPHARAGRP